MRRNTRREERDREEDKDLRRAYRPVEGFDCMLRQSNGRLKQESDVRVNKNYSGSCVKYRLWDKEGSKETNLEDFCKIVLVACVRKMGRLRIVHLLRSTRRT